MPGSSKTTPEIRLKTNAFTRYLRFFRRYFHGSLSRFTSTFLMRKRYHRMHIFTAHSINRTRHYHFLCTNANDFVFLFLPLFSLQNGAFPLFSRHSHFMHFITHTLHFLSRISINLSKNLNSSIRLSRHTPRVISKISAYQKNRREPCENPHSLHAFSAASSTTPTVHRYKLAPPIPP